MTLRYTIAQINPTLGDLQGNAQKILDVWNQAETDLVIFPELILSGYPPEDLILKPSFMDAIEAQMESLKQGSAAFPSAALVTTPWRIEDRIYNTAHLIQNGKTQAVVCKHHLPNYGVFDEKRIFSSAPLPEPVLFKGHALGIMICEDMWFPDVSAHLKDQGADILIVSNASPYDSTKHQRRLTQARARVQETGLPLIYAHFYGGQDDLVFDGGSFVMNVQGDVVAHGKFFEEDIIVWPAPSPASLRSAPSPIGRGGDPCEAWEGEGHIYQALKLALKDYVEKNNFPGVLLGLSGGVDSALVATLAVDALGSARVHAVILPSEFTSQDSKDDGRALADNLKIKLEAISIEPAVKALKATMPPSAPSVTFENIQSRARGVILMGLSNASGALLLSTGNKSELATGYATLYGDMCGGFNPLKDVYKTLVYKLCDWRNAQGAVIPQRILTKAPTAELKPNQTDQDTLPPYDVLDDILHGLIEEDLGIADLARRGHDEALIRRVQAMLDRAEYKRRQSAPGPKITTRAFGRDRRYPMTNAHTNFVEKR